MFLEPYKRNIFWKLFLLRTAFSIIFVATIVLFFTSYSDYCVLCVIGLAVLSCFSVDGLKIYNGSFEFTTYFVSGFFPVTWRNQLTDQFDIGTIELDTDHSLNHHLVEDDWFPSFFSFYDDGYKRSIIKIMVNGVLKKKIIVKLSDLEYELLFEFYLKQKHSNS